MVRKYYSPALKAWLGDLEDGKHDGGPEDPRIAVIKVSAKTATYAIATRTFVGRGVQIAKGVATGEAPNVNKLREISEDELSECERMISVPVVHSATSFLKIILTHGLSSYRAQQ